MNKCWLILVIFVSVSCNTNRKVQRDYTITQNVDSAIHTEFVSKIDSFSYVWSQFVADSLSVIEFEEIYITKITEFDSTGVKRKETETTKNIKHKSSTQVAQKAEETRKDSTKVDKQETTDKAVKTATKVTAKEREETKVTNAIKPSYIIITGVVVAFVLFLLFKLNIIKFKW